MPKPKSHRITWGTPEEHHAKQIILRIRQEKAQ